MRKETEIILKEEFYYMGQMHAINEPFKVQLPDNKNSAIQFTYRLENEIRKELFDYIIQKYWLYEVTYAKGNRDYFKG